MVNYLDYVYSRTKGSTAAGHVFASSINMGPSDRFYSSDLVKDEIIAQAGASTVSVTLPWFPVRLATVTLACGSDSAVVTNTTTGALGGTGVFATGFTGSILPSGVLAISAFNGTVTADVTITYRYDNESVTDNGPTAAGFTNVPGVNLQIKSIPVEAKARTLNAFWAFDASYELQKEYGANIEQLLATQIAGELNHKQLVA